MKSEPASLKQIPIARDAGDQRPRYIIRDTGTANYSTIPDSSCLPASTATDGYMTTAKKLENRVSY